MATTSSQAVRKRKATDDLPQLSPKRLRGGSIVDGDAPSEDSKTGGRIKSLHHEESHAEENVATAELQDDAAESPTPASDDGDRPVPQDEVDHAGSRESPTAGQLDGHQRQSGDEGVQTVNDADAASVREVMQLMDLVLERWRWMRRHEAPGRLVDRHVNGLAHLCDLLTAHEYIRLIPYLMPFLMAPSDSWWQEVAELKPKLRHLRESTKQLQEAIESLDRADIAYDAVVSKTTASIYGMSGRSEQALQLIREDVLAARQIREQARQDWDEAERENGRFGRIVWPAADQVLRALEKALKALASNDHIQGSEVRRSAVSYRNDRDGHLQPTSYVDEGRGYRGDGRPARRKEPQQRYRGGLSDGDFRHPKRLKPPPNPEKLSSDYRDSREYARDPHPGRREPSPTVSLEDIVEELQTDHARYLDFAKKSSYAAVKKFLLVRQNYNRDLAAFVQKQSRGLVRGTRTDFDNRYYISRNKANRDLTEAWKGYEYEVEQAEVVGAPEAQMMGLSQMFALAEGGLGEGGDDHGVLLMLQDMADERIEKWRDDEGLGEIVSERHWPALLSHPRQEGDSIGSVGEQADETRRATGKRRSLIDD